MESGNYSVFHVGYLVIKSVAYFPLQCALNSVPVVQAVLDSLRAHGVELSPNSMDAECAIIWSVLWAGKMAKNQHVYEHYRRKGLPVICIEVGALHRGYTWKIALNHITANGYYGHTTNLDWDRPRKLGISLSSHHGSKILIAAQHSRSLQVAELASMESWITNQVREIKQHTDRPIVVRPHPRSPLDVNRLPAGVAIQKPNSLPGTYDGFDMGLDYHAIINYNSGPGIQAAIGGVRPIVDKTSLAWPVGRPYNEIEDPYTVDRESWLTQICHTEYTVEEIQQGIWIPRIFNETSN